MEDTTQLNSTLLTPSVVAVLIPAAFHNAVTPTNGVDPLTMFGELRTSLH